MRKWIPRVKKRTLLLVAGLVWLAAGVNITLIGAPQFQRGWGGNWLYALLALLVFSLFAGLIFIPLTRRHSARILGMAGDSAPLHCFFDGRSYLIMAIMMGGGIWLRASGVAPAIFIGVMYLGIGTALLLAGVLFVLRYRAAFAPAG
jgi:hypothetical protein